MKSLVIGLAGCAAIALPPQAGATTQDDNFLAMLATAGIPAYDGLPSVIAAGHEVCDELDKGTPASEIANKLANDAYADAPVNSLDRYQRSMVRFVQVSAQAFCPGHAGSTALHSRYRVALIDDLIEPQPGPAIPEGPNVAHMDPPVAVAKPHQDPPLKSKPPPPETVPPPSQGVHEGPQEGGTGSGTDGGSSDSGGGESPPAPNSPGGHIVLLP